MRDVEGLRASAEQARQAGGDRRMLVITPELADTLADLADAAEGAATFEGPDGTPFCPVCDAFPEHCNCELRYVRDALARLDGEDTG